MTTKFVVDASVVLKWVLKETYSEKVVDLLKKDNSYNLLAPDIMITEVANALWKRVKIGEMSIEMAKALHAGIFVEDAVTIHQSAQYIERAFDLAHETGHNAIYDCVYLAMAESFNCDFLTADEVFFKKANKNLTNPNIYFIANLH